MPAASVMIAPRFIMRKRRLPYDEWFSCRNFHHARKIALAKTDCRRIGHFQMRIAITYQRCLQLCELLAHPKLATDRDWKPDLTDETRIVITNCEIVNKIPAQHLQDSQINYLASQIDA
jgi:hypothetical protein